MNDWILRQTFKGRNNERSKKRVSLNKKIFLNLMLLSLLIFTPLLVFGESTNTVPSFPTILSDSGFSNIELTNIETFPAGIYSVKLLAEFTRYHNENILSYYVVGTTDYSTIFTGPEGAFGSYIGGYVVPPVTKIFEADNEFGLSVVTPYCRYYTENYLNPDFPEQHFQVCKNLDNPNMFLIGFGGCSDGKIDSDYNDMVFILTLINPLKLENISRIPETPNYDEPVVVTSQIKKGSYEINSVVMSYQVDSGSWNNVTMNPDNNEHVGTIPPQQYGKTVNYKVYVSDTFGNTIVSTEYSYVVDDFVAPVILDLDYVPSIDIFGLQMKISANVFEPLSASGVKEVVLCYKLNTNDWILSETSLDDGFWVGNIPRQKRGTSVQFYVKAFDNAGNSAKTKTFLYTVVTPNKLPTADFSYLPNPGYPDDNISFDGSSSSDSDGYVITYFWNFGDETYSYGETTSHMYAEAGEYVVLLKVTDNLGGTDTKKKQ